MADAAGLGRITVFSALGQPLRAEIELNANSDELRGMGAKIASPESFRQAGLEYASALTGVKVSLDKRPTGQPVIRLSSDRPVSDPFIDLLLELNWASGRLVREYTFLLDPPDLSREVATSAPTAAAPATEMPVAKPAEMAVEKAVEKAPEMASAAPEAKPEDASAEEEPAKSAEVEERPVAVEEAPATERQVKSGDTLSKIAREVKPEGVALEQVLVSLFRANPEAFQGGNMNRLKSGKILTIPGKEALESVSESAARKEFVAHAQDWNAYRSKLAGVTAQEPATEKPAQTEVAGKITAKVEDKVAKPVDTKDQVKVSKTQTPGAQPPAVTKAAAEEEKIAREKALKESAERAAQLEKNVADLQKMAELKNKQLALAQAAAKPAAPAVKPTEPAAPATSTTLPVAPAAVSAVAATTPAAPAKAEGAKPEAEKMPTAPKPKPKAPPPAPVEEDEGLGIAVWGGLAALIAGIGGLVFYRRRKATPAEEVPFVSPSLGEPSLGANSVFRATGGQSIDTSAASPAVTDFSQTGPGTIDTDEVDPVAEAEVYMAYGRDAQAEEILLEALQKDSKRLAIHLKLLEIYSQRKSAKQFETLATELYAQTGGNGPEWDKAVAMGSQLDPANPLYAAGGSAAPSPFAAAPVAAAATGFDPDATVVVSSGSKSAPAAPTVPPADSAMSFDLNVGDLPQFGETPSFTPGDTQIKGAPQADQVPAGGNDLALDFDLDLGSSNIAPPAASDQNVDLGSGGLDFDLKLGDSQVAPHLDEEVPSNRADLSAINLDLGQSTDSGMMDLERTMLAVPGSMDSMATNILGGAGGGAGGGNALEQAVATKLDLAKAYEEMGDAEGARDLLQEALAEGTDAQKATAGAMLAKLG